ncbi:MAG TPA: hypothetical protein VLY24_27310 [Bryobacteraceae bacterium]|nr:hypothetical protein [Bryobacteraceae bacterium]
MKKRAILLLFAASMCAYAQDINNQGNQGDNDGQPAVPSKGKGELRPHVRIHQFIGPHANQAGSAVLNPSQINGAYGINLVAGLGQGATVAIVDAYDSPNVASDLANFSTTWGVSCPTGGGTFTKVNQSGNASPLPAYNSGWEGEINLDTQWVHAVAPCADIVLVEANSSSDSDLMAAVTTASSLASVVSMSWGGSEFSGQTFYDGYFVKSGVTFLASSGDTGGVIEWPSSSANVIAVGGTDLTLNSNGSVASETAWSGSGGGCSTVESAIPAQAGFVLSSSCTNRATPDVAMNGGGTSPVYVLISNQGGWYAVYGTSLSVQLWAGVIALANGLRSTPLNGTLADLYADAAGAPSSALYIDNYRDIVSGTAGSFSTGAGWDMVTGLGSPLANSLVPSYLVNQSSGSDFSLSGSPGSQTVLQGSATSYTVTASSFNGFNGSVSLSASGLPNGASATFTPNSISNGSGASTMSVTTSASTPAGTYTLMIKGTGNGLSHTTPVTLVVNTAPTPDFSLTTSPASQTVVQGSGTSYTATVTPSNGFTGSVNLTASGLPAGASVSFNPNPVAGGSGTSTVTVNTTQSAQTGTFTITITGTSGALVHQTSVKLVVKSAPDFSFTASPSSQTVVQGNGTSYTAMVTPSNGFTGSVNLTASGLPAGASVSFSPNPVAGGSGTSTMTVNTTQSAQTGTFTITITGTSGALVHQTSMKLVVKSAPDFSFTASPSSQTVVQGNRTSYTATVTSLNGFNGSVSFSANGLPSGATASFNPVSVMGTGSSTMTVTTRSTTPAGTYHLTITATSGALNHSANMTLVVNAASSADFSISASPASQSVSGGSGTMYTVTVTGSGGFAGRVSLGLSGAPSRTSTTFNPSSLTGSGSSTLTVTTSGRTPSGTYTLNITGTSGSLSHSTTVTFVVQ